ncbi:MAG TPA: rod shape-determining protein MreC [Polyangia bacterium]|nr:rod shape-determining protein MreC [Polyangia bacterium]
MTLTRRARELVIVATLLAVPVLFLRANLAASDHLNVVDRAILRVSAPLQAGLTGLVGGIGNGWTKYIALVHVKQDNARLSDENARLRAELVAAKNAAARESELEKLLALRASLQFDTIAARVVAVETSAFFRVVRVKLDRGGDDVKPGMAVVASAGVVGRVQRVFGGWCDVLLAADPKSSIDVVVARTGGRGVVKGIAGSDRYRTRIEYLERKDEAAEGDVVVTSGLGGFFPRDLPVGKIVKVDRRGFGLYQDAEVQPVVDFGKLRDVLVVVPREAQPAGPSAERK